MFCECDRAPVLWQLQIVATPNSLGVKGFGSASAQNCLFNISRSITLKPCKRSSIWVHRFFCDLKSENSHWALGQYLHYLETNPPYYYNTLEILNIRRMRRGRDFFHEFHYPSPSWVLNSAARGLAFVSMGHFQALGFCTCGW